MSAVPAGEGLPPVTGMCIVRAVRNVAPQVRLTVIVNLDVDQLSGETTHECPDRAAVFALVDEFLDRHERGVEQEERSAT